MKKIKLTQGKVALVDDEDFEWLNQWKWFANKKGSSFYAQRNRKVTETGPSTVYMHRVILGLMDIKIKGDHKDRNTLNNQRYNLREATNAQNSANKTGSKKFTSKYLGVSWHKGNNKWQSTIRKDYKYIYIGLFSCEKEAAKAYNLKAVEIHGEFANLNKL